MDASTTAPPAPPTPLYWPTVIASLGCGLVALPIGFVLTLKWGLSGYCANDVSGCGVMHPESGWVLALEVAALTAAWIAAVLLIVCNRRGSTPRRARVIGVLVATAVFHALVWPFFLTESFRGIDILVVPFVVAPLAAAFAGGFTTFLLGERPRGNLVKPGSS